MFCISHRIVEYFKQNKQMSQHLRLFSKWHHNDSNHVFAKDAWQTTNILARIHFGNDTGYQEYIIMIFYEIDCHDLSNVLSFYVLLIKILR